MVTKDLAYLLRRLQLGDVEAVLPSLYERAKTENWDYAQFLHAALDTAATTRAERAVARRIREAGFPSTTKTLDSYDFAAQPGLKKSVILQLATMDFVRQHDVAIFLGPTDPET